MTVSTQPRALDTRIRMEQAREAMMALVKIAEYPPQEQAVALAFLRGIQFAQIAQPHA